MRGSIQELKAHILSRCVESSNGCQEWQGSLNVDGYGEVRFGKKVLRTHRVIADASMGSNVMHSCDNPCCCNPSHLSIGDHKANMIDRSRKGRTVNKHGLQKLTEHDIRAIRASTEKHRLLGIKFGLSRSAISNIKSGARYSWVK